jgi:hypothetical protein
MSLRVVLSLSELTWAELIAFVDSVRSGVELEERVEIKRDGSESPAAMAVTVSGNSIGRGPAVIGAVEAAEYAAALRRALCQQGDEPELAIELQGLLEALA